MFAFPAGRDARDLDLDRLMLSFRVRSGGATTPGTLRFERRDDPYGSGAYVYAWNPWWYPWGPWDPWYPRYVRYHRHRHR